MIKFEDGLLKLVLGFLKLLSFLAFESYFVEPIIMLVVTAVDV